MREMFIGMLNASITLHGFEIILDAMIRFSNASQRRDSWSPIRDVEPHGKSETRHTPGDRWRNGQGSGRCIGQEGRGSHYEFHRPTSTRCGRLAGSPD